VRFWRIESPEYDSDDKHTSVNGSLEHPFGLPGVACDVCGDRWGGSRILPFDCPESFRHHEKLTNRWPISRAEHEALQKELMASIPFQGHPFIGLRPGDDFQPCFLDVPSRPRADFLWSSIGSLVVSERIKNALVESCAADIAVCPVTIRKIGKREAKLPLPMPSPGKPAGMIDEVPILKDTSAIGPYFEVLILKESEYPPSGTPTRLCPGCRRPDVASSTRELRMTPDMWKGDTIFFLATTLYVVITDELRERLVRHRPTNAFFEEI
jgi:Protein of unknown function (Gmx_para_CXXCG)